VFVVPEAARWSYLAEHAKGSPASGAEPARTIGWLIDNAMDIVMAGKPDAARHACRVSTTRTTSTNGASVS